MNDPFGATIPPTPVQSPRDRIGPYHVVKILGGGGMGIVYGGVGPDGIRVAIKVIRAEHAGGGVVARFAREASVRIEHPNVVRVLGAGADHDGTPYIAFEWLEGETLAQRIGRELLSEAATRHVITQACAGLAVAHASGVVHRDLKPENLFCCEDGVVKVLDFGIAHVGAAVTLTSEGSLLGTLSYLSPEQAQARGTIDARADVWALGVVMYRAISGKLPFDRESPVNTLMAIIQDEPVPLRTHAPHVSPLFADVVHACLAKHREDRWANVAALSTALADAAAGRPIALARTSGEVAPAIRAGEQRIVAVLLARGVRDMKLLEEQVHERNGTFVELLGAAAIGIFGAGSWEGDEAVRAASAAVQCRHAADRMAVGSGWARTSGGGLAGAAIEIAERGCGRGLFGVAVDAETARALGDRFSVQAHEDGWHEVLAERHAGWLARHAEPLPQLIGRDRELGVIADAFREVVSTGRARIVIVTGPTGIGKSALRRELEVWAPEAGASFVLTGRAEQSTHDVALSVFTNALRKRATRLASAHGGPRLDARAPPLERFGAVLSLIHEAIRDPALATQIAELLADRLGVVLPESVQLRAARNEPRLMADRTLLAVVDYLAGLASQGPIVLALEDLQWADPASLELIAELPRRLAGAPLFLFATARAWPDQLSFGETRALHWELGGLTSDDVGALATRITGRSPSDAVLAALVARTEGNPLFVEQITLELDERGLLDARDPGAITLPLTVEAALQSRLDLLPEAERDLCKRASIYGRAVTTDDLVALGVTDPEAHSRALVARRVLRPSGSAHGLAAAYHFQSDLMAEAAYRMNTPEVLVDLHRAAANRLAGYGADPEEVAVHRERSGNPAEAARSYAQAALTASTRGDSLRALRCSERALALGDPGDAAFALRMARSDAFRFLGRTQDQERELVAAREAAPDDVARARVLTEEVVWLSRVGRRDDARRVAEAAVDAARRSGDLSSLARALGRRAEVLIWAGGPGEAEEALAEAERLAEAATPEIRALVWAFRARLAYARGDLGRARASYERAISLYHALGDVRRAASAEANLADTYNRVGAYDAAEVALGHALEGCRRIGNRLMEGYALANLAYAYTMQGRPDEALARLDEADAIVPHTHDARLTLAVKVYRARTWLALGRFNDAAAAAESAATEAIRLKLASLAALALTVGARAHVAKGDTRRALDRSARALALRDSLGGAEDDEGEVFLAHIEALHAAGQHAIASEVRERAKARITEIADRIGDPEWRRRFLQDVPAHRGLLEDRRRG